MRITLLLTGKTKDSFIQEGMQMYEERLKHYVPFRVEVIPEVKHSGKQEMKAVMEKEGALIMQRLRSSDHVILLDERGKEFTSIGFAEHLSGMEGRVNHVVFVVGGPYGFSEQMYEAAHQKIALSKMTFSHQLVRLVFTEQLYRAFTILKGQPYHHQ